MTEFEKRVENLDKKLDLSDIVVDGWQILSTRFVAFFDIAGFKVTSKYKNYSYALLKAFKAISTEEQAKYKYDTDEYLYIVAISDSIIVFSKDDSIGSFCCFSQAIGNIFNKGILLGRVINAAVCYGEVSVDKENLIFEGLPYNKAYQLCEQMNYYGILCDDSISQYLDKNKHCTEDNYIYYKNHYLNVEYYIKCKESKDESIKTNNRLNYYWNNPISYNYILYTKIVWGMQMENLCADKTYGIVAGDYLQNIGSVIANYGEESPKIKNRLNNTIEVMRAMLLMNGITYDFDKYYIE